MQLKVYVQGTQIMYSLTFMQSYFSDLLDNSNYRLFVSEIDNVLQGFVLVNLCSHFENEDNEFAVEKLYVHENFQVSRYRQETTCRG